MIESQLGELAAKKKLKKRQRDGEGEMSEDEDSQIDRHDVLEEGGDKERPLSPHQLLSSSHRHGRMKTFVVSHFCPFWGVGPPCLPPGPSVVFKPHPLFQVVQPWNLETEPYCLWKKRWK